jgi:hypothetical protein
MVLDKGRMRGVSPAIVHVGRAHSCDGSVSCGGCVSREGDGEKRRRSTT